MTAELRVIWHRPTKRVADVQDLVSPHALTLDATSNWQSFNATRRMFQTSLERQRDAMLDPDFGIGIPIVEGAETAKDYAIGLLKLAAEIEHALMVQYLYAADSIDPADDERNLAKKIRVVAHEEMFHLGTVQNLLLLLGGPQAFHMQRDQIRKTSPANPIPLVLEPTTRLSLAKYVAAEAPEKVPEDRQTQVDELIALAAKDLGFEPRRVGAVYAMIRWMFLPEAEARAWMDLETLVPDAPLPPHPHLEDEDFQSLDIVETYELYGSDWGDESANLLLEQARDRSSALKALELITEQGEGFAGSEDAHFNEFLELVDEYDRLPFGRPIATSPTVAPGQGGEKPTIVTAPYTRTWIEVHSLHYRLLIVALLHAMAMPRTAADGTPVTARAELAAQSIARMRTIFPGMAKLLACLPVAEPGSGLAGPSYDLDPNDAETETAGRYVARQRAILDRLAVLYAQIEATPEPDPDLGIADLLRDLRRADRKSLKFLDALPAPPMV